jgi:M6 family metalloprotease-like protein
MDTNKQATKSRTTQHWQQSGLFGQMQILLAACLLGSTALAMPSLNRPVTLTQPDGAAFEATMQGDEWASWTETAQGNAVAKAKNGYWYYVQSFSGTAVILSSSRADFDPPVDAVRFLRPETSEDQIRVESQAVAGRTGPFTGRLLFILAQYANQPGTTSEASWANLLKQQVARYYDKASYGNVQLLPADETAGIANNGVVGWLTIGPVHPNTGANTGIANQQIAKSAIQAADPYVNFSSFDSNDDGLVTSDELAVVIVVAGGERAYDADGNTVWGHAWDINIGAPVVDGKTVGLHHNGGRGYAQFGEKHGSHQATMGIVVHELGHLIFGLPDLYDTDRSSAGIGGWCVMGTGGWGQGSRDSFAGQTPVLPSAWVKVSRGWVTPITSGHLALMAAGDAGADATNTVFKIGTRGGNEYFLIENRQPAGYDLGLYPQLGSDTWGGFAVYHIDDNQYGNATDGHRRVDLEEADGNENYNGTEAADLWYLGSSDVFSDFSLPNSQLYGNLPSGLTLSNFSSPGAVMTASLVAGVPVQATLVAPSSGMTVSSTTPTYQWNVVPGADRYLLQVNSLFGIKISISYTKEEAGCASGTGICSVTPASPLFFGTFLWRIQAKNSSGDGPWSELDGFMVLPPMGASAHRGQSITQQN